MNSEFYLWLCYVKLLVYDPDKNSCRWDLVYRSLPAKYYNHLSGFPNEKLTIIAILKFHPMNRCAIAEIDEPEPIKASINVLMIENNWYNIRLWTTVFMKTSNLVAYYGFDVETVMQLAANKQVDIIIVNTIYVAYGDKYREVDWIETEIIQMLKSNPETAQIPVIVKLSGQVMVGDQDRYLAESGADEAICVQVDSLNSLVEKIKHTLSADDSSLNTRINKNRIATYPEPKVGEGANLARFRNQLSNILTPEPRKFAIVRSRTASAIFFDSRGLNTPG